MSRLSRWTPLSDRVFQNRQRRKRSNKRRMNTSTEYTVALVGAMCQLECAAVRRPNGKFYHGLVSHIPKHRAA